MRKLTLFIMAACFVSATTMAADKSIKETFCRVSGANTTSTASGLNLSGDLCSWKATYARFAGTNDKITIDGTATNAWWLPKSNDTQYGKLETTNLEGGIKAVSFYWAQFAGGEGGNTLKLKVKAGTIEHDPAFERDGSLGGNKTNPGDPYEHTFNCKTNVQLEITNVSTWETKAGDCRILVGPITITPYLHYRQKEVTIGVMQQGYINNELINNTEDEGTISYSSSAEGIAKVDAATGVISPIAVGDAVITATWSEGALTTYTIHVVDGIVAENFSKVSKLSQISEETTWHGDLFDWNVNYVRRGVDDTLGICPRIQATAMRYNTNGSYIYTAEPIEGGVKHIAFDWRQWAKAEAPLNMAVFYSSDKENWGDAVYTETEAQATASTPHVYDKDIDDGTKGNAYLRIKYTSGDAHAVVGAIKITPWLLYTKKAASINLKEKTSYTNTDLINNTTGDPVVYEISTNTIGATINTETGEVTAGTETGVVTVTAKWKNVTTSYELTILADSATGMEEVGSESVKVRSEKKLIDGQLVIIREGKKYNAQGAIIEH